MQPFSECCWKMCFNQVKEVEVSGYEKDMIQQSKVKGMQGDGRGWSGTTATDQHKGQSYFGVSRRHLPIFRKM